MTGFLVSTAAVFLTAWIVYAATYRAAYMQGQMDMLRDAARNQGIVPTGTRLPQPTRRVPMPAVRPPAGGTFTGYQPRACPCEICQDERNGSANC